MAKAVIVRDARAAAALADGRGLPFLGQYLHQPRSIQQVAERLGVTIAKSHYWTHRWHDLGLLDVVETRRRAGRPIRFYRTVGQEFEVPADVLPGEIFEAQMERSRRKRQRDIELLVPEMRSAAVLRIYARGPEDALWVDRSIPHRLIKEDLFSSNFSLRLTKKDAVRLRRELEDLRDRWTEQRGGRDETHVVTLELSPVATA